MSKDTLNIYEVLELLNKKINSNTSLIEKTNSDTLDSISEVKSYLLEKLKSDLEESKNILNDRLDNFKKAISYGLNMNQDLAMAKLSLAGILMQKRRKREAVMLLNEAKKLDKHGLLIQQIKLMQTQMKRI